MSKKKKSIIITLIVIIICLIGFLAFAVGSKISDKNDHHPDVKIESKAQTKSKKLTNSSNSSNSLADKLDDNDYYVLATIKEINTNSPDFRIDLKTLNQDAQKWTIQGDCFRLGQQNDGKMGIIPNGNGAGDEFISIDKNNVTVAHMGGGKDNASDHWMNQTFSKKDLVNEYIKSENDVNLLKQTVTNLSKNNDAYNSSVAQEKSEESVDTKNLTTDQVENWVFRSVRQEMNSQSDQSHQLTPNDQHAFDYQISTDDKGRLEINVKQNPNSDYFKKSQMDPNSTYSFGIYRINGKGELQEMNNDRTKWETVSTSFADPSGN